MTYSVKKDITRSIIAVSMLFVMSSPIIADDAPANKRLEILPRPSPPPVTKIREPVADGFRELIGDVGRSIPAVRSIDYHVSSFCAQWSLPQKAKMRLVSNTATDQAKVAAADYSVPYGTIGAAIVSSAVVAKNTQALMGMETVILDIDIEYASPPKIHMSFLPRKQATDDGMNTKDDDCSQALQGK